MARKRKPKADAGSGAPTPQAVAADVPPQRDQTALRTTFKALAALVAAGGVVVGLAWVGREAGLSVAGRDRYAVKVSDISCDTPSGVDRSTFLTEVRYLGNLPETVQTVAPDLAERLTTAFTAHPWVAGVDGVTVSPEGTVRVALRFRVPVLAVTTAGESAPRVVDAGGVLLPPTAPTTGLATLEPMMLPPQVPAGKLWPDPDVKRAAELAAEFKAVRMEKADGFWRVTKPGGVVLRVGW